MLKHGVRIQDLPLLCQHVLEHHNRENGNGDLIIAVDGVST
jgi:hypothetical protein